MLGASAPSASASIAAAEGDESCGAAAKKRPTKQTLAKNCPAASGS